MSVKINYSNGRKATAESVDSAIAMLTRQYPDLHSVKGEDRTLVWETEEASENDDGAKAVAEIRAA